MDRRVELSRKAQKQIAKLPRHIVENLAAWVDDVENDGLEETRQIPSYHDESLHGERQGQRSIRLSRSYRVIYVLKKRGLAEYVSVEEITKHEY